MKSIFSVKPVRHRHSHNGDLLARISHKLPTAAVETLSLQGLAPSRDFDILSSIAFNPFLSARLVGRYFVTLTTKLCEKCGLATLDLFTSQYRVIYKMIGSPLYRATCWLLVLSLLSFLSLRAEAQIPAQNPTQKSDDFHICYFSLNNEKEFTEMQKFTKKLNERSPRPISVEEYLTEGENPKESFQAMVESGKSCDGLVISGHHTGAFGGKRAPGSLGIDFLEKLSCNKKYSPWFKNVKALWLQGCRTLGTGEIVAEDEEGSADYHTGRVGAVLDADHLEQSLADLNMEFSTTLDQDNPLSSRYLRAFPAANVFGWTKTAPGERSGSQYSIPFHMAHISRLIDHQDRFPEDSPIARTWTEESTLQYFESLKSVLSGGDECGELVVSAWKNHGRVQESTEYGFANPDLNAHRALGSTDDKTLKQARLYDCLLKNSQGKKLLDVLDKILENPTFIRYTYNSLLERLQNLRFEEHQLHSAMIKKLRNSQEMRRFLSDKLKGQSLGILRKIDYFAFYEKVYGKNPRIKSLIFDKAAEAFRKIPSRTDDEINYKITLLQSLEKHDYIASDKGLAFLQQVLEDQSEGVRRTAVRSAGTIGEKALPIIQKALEDQSEDVRNSAAYSAGRIGEKALPIIQKAIEDQSEDVRQAAAYSAGRIGEKALPIIQKAIEDQSEIVRRAAAQSAGDIGEKALPIIQKALEDQSEDVRNSAAYSAGRIGEKALPIIQKAIEDQSEIVRRAAAQSAGRIGEKALPIIQKAIEDQSEIVRSSAAYSAGRIGEKALPIIQKAIEDQSEIVRSSAAYSAGRIGEKALPIIQKALEDQSEKVRRTALESTFFLGKKALPLLKEALDNPLLSQEEKERTQHIIEMLSGTL